MMRRIAQGAVALGTVLAVLVVGAPDAAAADGEVRLRTPRTFTAGGSPGEITLEVDLDADDDECVVVSMLLEVELAGVADGEVQAAIRADGRWRTLRLSRTGGDRFLTEPVAPDDPRVCGDDPRASVLLSLALATTVAADEITLVGRAFTESGELLDATDESRDVRPGRGGPRPTASPSPTVPASDAVPEAAAAAPSVGTEPLAAARRPAGSGPGTGTILLTAFGIALVGLGVALLVMLVRGNRRDGADGLRDRPTAHRHRATAPHPPGGDTHP